MSRQKTRGALSPPGNGPVPIAQKEHRLKKTLHLGMMRAATLVRPRRFELDFFPVPVPAEDEIRIKVRSCGICSSNLAPWRGAPWFNYPFEPGSPGHETAGFVDAVGSKVSNRSIGEYVATLSFRGFAEYDIAKERNVVPIPHSAGDGPFLAEPLGCAMNVFGRAQVRKSDWVAIVGLGFLGTLIAQLCLGASANVIGLSRRPFALEMAQKIGLGMTLSTCGDTGKVIEAVREYTGGNFCDVVVEAGGSQPTLDLASELTRIRGRLVIAGYHQDGPRTINMQQWNWRGLDVVNAHERDEAAYIRGIEAALDQIAKGNLRPDPLITHTFPLEAIDQGFRIAEERPEGFFKAAIMA